MFKIADDTLGNTPITKLPSDRVAAGATGVGAGAAAATAGAADGAGARTVGTDGAVAT